MGISWIGLKSTEAVNSEYTARAITDGALISYEAFHPSVQAATVQPFYVVIANRLYSKSVLQLLHFAVECKRSGDNSTHQHAQNQMEVYLTHAARQHDALNLQNVFAFGMTCVSAEVRPMAAKTVRRRTIYSCSRTNDSHTGKKWDNPGRNLHQQTF